MRHVPRGTLPPATPTEPTDNAPAWRGLPGWMVYAVTTDPAAAAVAAHAVAAEHRARLAPGTWPVDTPADIQRIAVGPVYVGVRTRRGHENGIPLATYYVLRRWVASADVPEPDPTWPVPGARPAGAPAGAAGALMEPAPPPPLEALEGEGMGREPDPAWPFVAVGRRTSRAGAKTLGADIITWRGRLETAAGGRTITFTTQPRKRDAHASFLVSANARIHYTTLHPEFVDVLVHHALSDAERAQLAALAQAQDTRPVVVRCVGERLRAAPAAEARDPAPEPSDAPSRLPEGAPDA